MCLADKLTFLRILLAPLFVALLFYASPQAPQVRYWAAAIFLLAVLTDFFDGMAARIRKEKSEIGAIIDPLADKILLLSSFIALYALRRNVSDDFIMPIWLVLIVVSRDALVLLGVATLNFMKIEVKISPSFWGKLATSFQMAAILTLLLELKVFPHICFAAAVFTVISGIEYFRVGVAQINARINTSR